MRIFVTGLMMFIGGLGVGLGFGMLTVSNDSISTEVAVSYTHLTLPTILLV